MDRWDIVWKRVRGLPQLWVVVSEPAIAPKLAGRAVTTHFRAEVRRKLLQLFRAEAAVIVLSRRRTGALTASSALGGCYDVALVGEDLAQVVVVHVGKVPYRCTHSGCHVACVAKVLR